MSEWHVKPQEDLLLKEKLSKEIFEALPDALKEHYSEGRDGAYYLSVEEHAGLKTAYERTTEELRNLKTRLKDMEGIDPTQYRQLLEDANKREEENARRRGDFEKLSKLQEQKFLAEKEELAKLATRYRTILERATVDAQLTAAISSHRGVPDILKPLLERHVKVEEVDGDFQVRVVDPTTGKVRMKDASTAYSVEDLVVELKGNEKFSRVFDGSGVSGAGSSNSTSTPALNGTYTKLSDFKSFEEKDAYIKKFGVEAFQKLTI